MAKYTATIDEDTRQRIHALPRNIHFSVFIRKAITIFVEELEKNPELEPGNFILLGFPIISETVAGIETEGTMDDTLRLNLLLRTGYRRFL